MTIRRTLVAIAIGAVAAFASAQNADKNTAAPTANDYRLRVVEPAEGATVSGSNVQVVVDLNSPRRLGDDQRDTNSMPHPRVDVFVDNDSKGTLEENSNVLTIASLSEGPHKLVVLAKNLSGEIIDRKEVNFDVASASTATTSGRTSTAPAPMTTDRSAMAPAPNPDRSTATTYTAPPPAPMASSRETSPAPAPETLPETASYDPLLAVGGLALLATGLVLHRRS